MRITLKQLQVFVNTAKSASISLGAEKCFISQAAASMSLSQLEHMLGVTLFDRFGKRIRLNTNGHNLLTKAIQILDKVDEFESLAINEKSLTGKITIGASTTIANYVLPKYIAQFKTIHPNVSFKLICDNSKEIIHDIKTLSCDVAFIEGECHSDAIDATLWKKDNLKIVCNAKHPLCQKSTVTIKDTLKYEWVTRERGSGIFDIFLKALESHIPDIKKAITLNSSEAIKQYIANSDSLACLSEVIITQAWNLDKYSSLDVQGLDLSRNFYKLLHNKKYYTHLTQAFCDFIENDI